MSGNEHVLVFTRARDSRAFIMHHPFREVGNNFFRGRVPPVREPRTIGRRIDKQKTQSKEYDKYKNKAESFSKLGTAFTPWLITVGLVSTPDNRAYVLLVQM